jgi:pyruvate formate lyase activating enzyme
LENRCVGCGACAAACPKGVHVISDGRRSLNRSLCDGCGECARICPADAIDLRGAVMDVAGVMDIVRRDMPFYAATGGGVTISGGEPLYQFDFTRELLVAARNEGVHTCLDTSGWGGRAAELVSLVDIFLWDIKETDAIRHRAHTGAELDDIVDSLRAVDAAGGIIRLRCPLIPGVNARPEHMRSVGRLANSLKGVVGVDLIAYHELGAGKQSAMGETPARFGRLSDAEKDALFSALSESTPVQAGWHI